MARKYKSRVSTDKLDAKIEQQKEALEKTKARYEAEKEALEVQVPANTTAVIYLPEKEGGIEVGSGIHLYEYATSYRKCQLILPNVSEHGGILSETPSVSYHIFL